MATIQFTVKGETYEIDHEPGADLPDAIRLPYSGLRPGITIAPVWSKTEPPTLDGWRQIVRWELTDRTVVNARLVDDEEPTPRGAPPRARTLLIDPLDGELVRVEPANAWQPERWGPLSPGFAVVRILAAAPRCEPEGQIAQRNLSTYTLVRDADGRVPRALGGRSL